MRFPPGPAAAAPSIKHACMIGDMVAMAARAGNCVCALTPNKAAG
jgi:hypothetical protein